MLIDGAPAPEPCVDWLIVGALFGRFVLWRAWFCGVVVRTGAAILGGTLFFCDLASARACWACTLSMPWSMLLATT